MVTKSFKQLIYCNNESKRNYPLTLTDSFLINSDSFLAYYPIIQLGVQAPPGTKFYINDNADPVIVGQTGLFDLDLTNSATISALRFDNESIQRIMANDSNILIIDMLYLQEEGG